MRVPNLEALIAEGEQEALLDFGYEHVIRLTDTYRHLSYTVDSTDLHAEAGRLMGCGQLDPEAVTTVYDALWSVKRALQDEHGPNRAGFTAQQWADMARLLSRRLDNSPTSP